MPKLLKQLKIHCLCKQKSCHQSNIENCLCPLHFINLKEWRKELKIKMEVGMKAAEIFEEYKTL